MHDYRDTVTAMLMWDAHIHAFADGKNTDPHTMYRCHKGSEGITATLELIARQVSDVESFRRWHLEHWNETGYLADHATWVACAMQRCFDEDANWNHEMAEEWLFDCIAWAKEKNAR